MIPTEVIMDKLMEKAMEIQNDLNYANLILSDASKGLCNKQSVSDILCRINSHVEFIEKTPFPAEDSVIGRDSKENPDNIGNDSVAEQDGLPVSDRENQNPKETFNALKEEMLYLYDALKPFVSSNGNFNKKIFLSNVRMLLKQYPSIKIGQIEKEAGVRPGYMSRLEKEGNTSSPCMEFIASAAKLLKVSIDALTSMNLSDLTPKEEYVLKFFDKLKADTISEKLEWNTETSVYLNRVGLNYRGRPVHPLYSISRPMPDDDADSQIRPHSVYFNSRSFGLFTSVRGDCYNVSLKDKAVLYLMNIGDIRDTNILIERRVIEAWIYDEKNKPSFLISSMDSSQLKTALISLYDTVKVNLMRPQIGRNAISAIDSYMYDDFPPF